VVRRQCAWSCAPRWMPRTVLCSRRRWPGGRASARAARGLRRTDGSLGPVGEVEDEGAPIVQAAGHSPQDRIAGAGLHRPPPPGHRPRPPRRQGRRRPVAGEGIIPKGQAVQDRGRRRGHAGIATGLGLHRRDRVAQRRRRLGGIEGEVQAHPDHDHVEPSRSRRRLDQDAAQLPLAREEVVRPLELGFDAPLPRRLRRRDARGQRQHARALRGQARPQQHRQEQVACGRQPRPALPAAARDLALGDHDRPFRCSLARSLLEHVVRRRDALEPLDARRPALPASREQPPDLPAHSLCVLCGQAPPTLRPLRHSISSEMSAAGAECVSAPTAM
jgi:hypothetical protein